jgi:hypothetical protein
MWLARAHCKPVKSHLLCSARWLSHCALQIQMSKLRFLFLVKIFAKNYLASATSKGFISLALSGKKNYEKSPRSNVHEKRNCDLRQRFVIN